MKMLHTNFNKIIIVLLILLKIVIVHNKLFDTSSELLSRHKRTLVWFEGVNWVQTIVGIGLPTELEDQSITIGTVAKAFYLLPTNSSFYTHPGVAFLRKKRSATRWSLYKLIEQFFERTQEGSGKVCMLRAICEASYIGFDEKAGILSEIVHVLLRPSTTNEILDSHLDNQYHAAEKLGRTGENCRYLFPECQLNIVEKFTKFLF